MARLARAFARTVWHTMLLLLLGKAGVADASAAPTGNSTPLGRPHPTEGLEAWINVRVIQKLTHHTSAVIVAVVLFWAVGLIIQRLMHDSFIKRWVLLIDEFVLLFLFIYFAYELIIFF